MAEPPDPTASFGYRDVPADEKAGMVREVFESVAPRYDLMNDLMSGGVPRLWKNTLVDVLNPRPGERFLDVAGGTGDIAFRIVRRLADKGAERPDVTICDINAAMLEVGRDRARRSRAVAGADLDDRRCRGLAVARQVVRCLHDRLRIAQRHPYRQGARRKPGAC